MPHNYYNFHFYGCPFHVVTTTFKAFAINLLFRTGNGQVWYLYWNKAIGWDEKKLVSGHIASDHALERLGQAIGIGAGHRVNGREGTTLAVGFSSACLLNERIKRPVPVRHELD